MVTEENCILTNGCTKSCYTRVKEELLKVNVKVSKYDLGLFSINIEDVYKGYL